LNGVHKDSKIKDFKIPYFYILVNKKSNYKFFEAINNKQFVNPKSGLAIFDSATDGNAYEFFVQPQIVTQGTATPTHYHVAFGNFSGFEVIVPKLTYDLCYMYANWPGPVRVPHILKSAEKLAKMVSKNIKMEIHPKLNKYQCYL